MDAEAAAAPLTIAFVGLGGAGQRHARVLRELLGHGTRWLGVRRRGTTPVLDARFAPQSTSMAEALGIDTVPSLADALSAGVDLVVVATPTSLHADAVAEAIGARCPVLVEKPVASSFHDAAALASRAAAAGVPLCVGFQRRFHPGWLETRRLVDDGAVGQVTGGDFWARSNVAAWHPYEPLSELYAVRRDLGGGVIRTESHELDLALGLFGEPLAVRCVADRSVEPNGVEHVAELTLEYRGARSVRVSVSFDAATPERGWTIIGDRGRLSWDEISGTLTITAENGRMSREKLTGFGNDELVARQDRWVLDHLGDPSASGPGLAQAVLTSRVIESALLASTSS